MPGKLLRLVIFLTLLGLVLFLPAKKTFDLPIGKQALIEEKYVPEAPILSAKSALAKDFSTGKILFEKEVKTLLPLASLTKLISLSVIFDLVEFNDIVRISDRAIRTPEPSSLVAGEHLLVKDLAAMAMVSSTNDAVSALIEHAASMRIIPREIEKNWFLGLMYDKVESWGIQGMLFYDYIGLDLNEEIAGAYGTAENMMQILQSTEHSILWQFGDITEVISEEGRVHILKPTNALKPELNLLVGAKTGFTDIAGGNLTVIIEYPFGHPIGIVVLGSTEEGRFDDTKKILDWIKSTQ